MVLQSEPPRGRNRAQSVGGWSGATASFLSSLPPLHPLPQTKHNINNIDYTNKIATIPVSVMTDYETPQPRKRSQTRVLATEKARESYTEAAAIVENLKTAVEGRMEVLGLIFTFLFSLFGFFNFILHRFLLFFLIFFATIFRHHFSFFSLFFAFFFLFFTFFFPVLILSRFPTVSLSFLFPFFSFLSFSLSPFFSFVYLFCLLLFTTSFLYLFSVSLDSTSFRSP